MIFMKVKSPKQASTMPLPNNPGTPESPPPNIPIPGTPAGGGELQSFKCPKCGKVYNSKEELKEHMHGHTR